MVNNNGDDGKGVANEALENESKTVEQTQEQKEAQPKNAFIGVDGEGYYVCKIHTSQHPWMIIGFLHDAISQYRGMVIAKQKELEEQRRKLMGRGRGFFNLLKPK